MTFSTNTYHCQFPMHHVDNDTQSANFSTITNETKTWPRSLDVWYDWEMDSIGISCVDNMQSDRYIMGLWQQVSSQQSLIVVALCELFLAINTYLLFAHLYVTKSYWSSLSVDEFFLYLLHLYQVQQYLTIINIGWPSTTRNPFPRSTNYFPHNNSRSQMFHIIHVRYKGSTPYLIAIAFWCSGRIQHFRHLDHKSPDLSRYCWVHQ
jgi:hypothetical protein